MCGCPGARPRRKRPRALQRDAHAAHVAARRLQPAARARPRRIEFRPHPERIGLERKADVARPRARHERSPQAERAHVHQEAGLRHLLADGEPKAATECARSVTHAFVTPGVEALSTVAAPDGAMR